jgi:hypothetical protein
MIHQNNAFGRAAGTLSTLHEIPPPAASQMLANRAGAGVTPVGADACGDALDPLVRAV